MGLGRCCKFECNPQLITLQQESKQSRCIQLFLSGRGTASTVPVFQKLTMLCLRSRVIKQVIHSWNFSLEEIGVWLRGLQIDLNFDNQANFVRLHFGSPILMKQ